MTLAIQFASTAFYQGVAVRAGTSQLDDQSLT